MEFIAAKCPNCAGDLRVPDNLTKVLCMYCGFDVYVQTPPVATGPSIENLKALAFAAEEAGNAEEAYEYFKRVLEFEPDNFDALVGKAIAAEKWHLSPSAYSEKAPPPSMQTVGQAIEKSVGDLRSSRIESATRRIAKSCPSALEFIHRIDPHNENALIALYKHERRLADLQIEFGSDTWFNRPEYEKQCQYAETWLEQLRQLNPQAAELIRKEANEESAPLRSKQLKIEKSQKMAAYVEAAQSLFFIIAPWIL